MPLAWWRDTRSSLRSKGVQGGVSLEGACFERKIFNFYQKNNFGPIDFLLARLSSEAMSAYRATKPKAWETVRKKVAIIYEHVLMCFKKKLLVRFSSVAMSAYRATKPKAWETVSD